MSMSLRLPARTIERKARRPRTIAEAQLPKKVGRKARHFNWEEILQGRAWQAPDIALILGMKLPAARRQLRRAVNIRQLVMRKNGRFKYYASKVSLTSYRASFANTQETIQRSV